MNAGPEFRSALVAAGFNAARAEAVIRYLGEAGAVPRGGRGRYPKSNLAWGASHYAMSTIGFGSIQPIDAPDVVVRMGALKHTASNHHDIVSNNLGQNVAIQQVPDRTINMNLLGWLATDIELIAELSADDRETLRTAAKGLFIRLDASRLEASVPFQFPDGSWGVDQFGPPKQNQLMPEPPKLSWGFEVKLEIEIIFIAADLLAETMAKQSGGTEPPKGGLLAGSAAEGGEAATNGDAPDLAGSEASRGDRSCNQSRLRNASGQVDGSEDREGGIFAQQRIPASGWVSPTLRRKIPEPCLLSTA